MSFSYQFRTHVSGGEGHDGGSILVAEDGVRDGGHGVSAGGRGGEIGATKRGPQEGGHPVTNKIE